MTDEQNDETRTIDVPMSENAFILSQKLSIESHERIQRHHIDANKEIALNQSAEHRRTVALNCALASLGVGHQSLNPPPTKPDAAEVLTRAYRFDAFIRGAPEGGAVVVPIETPPAA